MISSVSSTLSGAGNSASSRIAKIDALSKQANTLRQQLAQEQQPGTQASDATKTNSISQELVTIQSQIERLVLDGQLSRLTSADESSSTSDASASTQSGQENNGKASEASATSAGVQKSGSRARHGDTHSTSKRPDPYHVAEVLSGNYVNVQA
jgi:hypothetical protein